MKYNFKSNEVIILKYFLLSLFYIKDSVSV